MLIFGPYRACLEASRLSKNFVITNYTSSNESIPRLIELLPNPPDGVGKEDLPRWYDQYILLNDYAFVQMMSIMFPLYEGRDVFVCTCGDCLNGYLMLMNDLLAGYIRDRYGYNSIIINEGPDLESFDRADFGFSAQGIMNLDIDRTRYTQNVEVERLKAGGRPYAEQ